MAYTALFITLLGGLFLGGCSTLHPLDSGENHYEKVGYNSHEANGDYCQVNPETEGCENYHSDHARMDHGTMISSEFDFISLMIPHHQEAVDTARVINAKTSNEEVKKLTQDIMDAQNKEIGMMQGWRDKWYSGQHYTGMPYMSMMRASNSRFYTSVEEEEQVWLEDMIVHHEGAIAMAEKLLKIMDANDPRIRVSAEAAAYRQVLREFANAIILNQSNEIDEMKIMLAMRYASTLDNGYATGNACFDVWDHVGDFTYLSVRGCSTDSIGGFGIILYHHNGKFEKIFSSQDCIPLSLVKKYTIPDNFRVGGRCTE